MYLNILSLMLIPMIMTGIFAYSLFGASANTPEGQDNVCATQVTSDTEVNTDKPAGCCRSKGAAVLIGFMTLLAWWAVFDMTSDVLAAPSRDKAIYDKIMEKERRGQ